MPSILEGAKNLAQTILPQSFLESTDEKLRSTNIAFSGSEFCGISLLVGIAAAAGIMVASFFISFPLLPSPVYAGTAFILSFLVLTLVLPYFFIERRIGELEDSLPDALRQMSTALRAGVSMDEALEDVAQSNYGALSEEFERTLAQVRRGRPMKGALRAMARRTQSELFERAFYLVVEGMERGAELADVLEAVSDDIREIHTVQRERRATTMQQIMFLLAAALFAAPFITGLVLELGNVFSSIEMGAGTGAGGGATDTGASLSGRILPKGTRIVVPLFIAIQAAITSLAVGVIRYGEISKGLIYLPLFVTGAMGVFYGAQFAAGFML